MTRHYYEQQRGMMFRRSLDDDKGMLFPFETPQVATFWMENTYVSSDMIFINADGTVHRIEKMAEPLSTRTISAGAPVLAVLEVVAGMATVWASSRVIRSPIRCTAQNRVRGSL